LIWRARVVALYHYWEQLKHSTRETAMNVLSLKKSLSEWTDFDVAAYWLAVALGIVDATDFKQFGPLKWLFWTANPIEEGLAEVLDKLVELGVLQKQSGPQYRWNPAFAIPATD
jgi:hypothetical protein